MKGQQGGEQRCSTAPAMQFSWASQQHAVGVWLRSAQCEARTSCRSYRRALTHELPQL